MDRFETSSGTLECQVRGSGDPLLMIHGGIISDEFEGLAPALQSAYQLITYRRRGYGGSSPARESETIANQASDAAGLLDYLGVDAAHVAGHSYGGAVALQLACDHPTRVHSLSLLEPGLLAAAPSGAAFGAGLAPLAQLYESGDSDGTLVTFLTAVGGEGVVPRISQTLAPGWYEQALRDLPTLFGADLPSLVAWKFGELEVRSIHQTAFTVRGSNTSQMNAESHDLLKAWLPDSVPFILDGASHMLHMDNPDAMAAALLDFLARHPMRRDLEIK